jgi:hypothetical protein
LSIASKNEALRNLGIEEFDKKSTNPDGRYADILSYWQALPDNLMS